MGWFLAKAIERELARVREAVSEELSLLRRETRLVAERSEASVSKLLSLESRVAALEATTHKVSYVPVDAMKSLTQKQVDEIQTIPEKVRDTLKEIVDLQERIKGFQDLDNFEETL